MKEKKKNYEAPQLIAVTFKMEQGFTLSTRTIGMPPVGTNSQQEGIQNYAVEESQSWF